VNSDKLVAKLLSKYFDDMATPAARDFVEDLQHLVRAAQAEQRIRDAEAAVARPEYRDACFSIDSWR
jgi:hypothetical protein